MCLPGRALTFGSISNDETIKTLLKGGYLPPYVIIWVSCIKGGAEAAICDGFNKHPG